MTDPRHDLLPPEDATSWEEFQERWAIERARDRVAGRSWRDTARIMLSVIPGLAAVVIWVAFALATGPVARWLLLALALACTLLFGLTVGGVLRRRGRARHRRRQLDRLRGEWQARAERGEIPRTSPGGPRVWRSQIHPEVPKAGGIAHPVHEPEDPGPGDAEAPQGTGPASGGHPAEPDTSGGRDGAGAVSLLKYQHGPERFVTRLGGCQSSLIDAGAAPVMSPTER